MPRSITLTICRSSQSRECLLAWTSSRLVDVAIAYTAAIVTGIEGFSVRVFAFQELSGYVDEV